MRNGGSATFPLSCELGQQVSLINAENKFRSGFLDDGSGGRNSKRCQTCQPKHSYLLRFPFDHVEFSADTCDFPMLKRIFIPSPMGMAEKQLSVEVVFIADIQIPLEITAAEA